MLHKMSIRLKLSLITAMLLSICCIGLTIILNYNAYKAVDMLQVPLIIPPTFNEGDDPAASENNSPKELASSTVEAVEAKSWFSDTSLFYMFLFVIGGGMFTYFIVGKTLAPLLKLNNQVKNITVHNLSQTINSPSSQDEIYELTVSFNKMVNKLNDAFLMQKQFSASVAHELRTPLTVLQTKIDVFNKQPSHQEQEYKELIRVINHQSLRLRNLVETLLEMTNMDDNNEVSFIDLSEMMKDIISELSTLAKKKNIEIKLCADDSTILGNIDLFYRVFYNLIENAIKYNIENGKVEIMIQKNELGLKEVLIKDTGIGILEIHREHIFEPFFRIDKSRSREIAGVGLGLAFVRNIVTKQGGNIEVVDDLSEGTCFRLLLK